LEIAWAGLTRLEGSNPSLSASGNGEPKLSGTSREILVEAGKDSVVVLRREQDAAIRELEAGSRAKRRQPGRRVFADGKLLDGEPTKSVARKLQLAGSRRRDQGLGETDRASAELAAGVRREQLPRTSVVRVATVQMAD